MPVSENPLQAPQAVEISEPGGVLKNNCESLGAPQNNSTELVQGSSNHMSYTEIELPHAGRLEMIGSNYQHPVQFNGPHSCMHQVFSSPMGVLIPHNPATHSCTEPATRRPDISLDLLPVGYVPVFADNDFPRSPMLVRYLPQIGLDSVTPVTSTAPTTILVPINVALLPNSQIGSQNLPEDGPRVRPQPFHEQVARAIAMHQCRQQQMQIQQMQEQQRFMMHQFREQQLRGEIKREDFKEEEANMKIIEIIEEKQQQPNSILQLQHPEMMPPFNPQQVNKLVTPGPPLGTKTDEYEMMRLQLPLTSTNAPTYTPWDPHHIWTAPNGTDVASSDVAPSLCIRQPMIQRTRAEADNADPVGMQRENGRQWCFGAAQVPGDLNSIGSTSGVIGRPIVKRSANHPISPDSPGDSCVVGSVLDAKGMCGNPICPIPPVPIFGRRIALQEDQPHLLRGNSADQSVEWKFEPAVPIFGRRIALQEDQPHLLRGNSADQSVERKFQPAIPIVGRRLAQQDQPHLSSFGNSAGQRVERKCERGILKEKQPFAPRKLLDATPETFLQRQVLPLNEILVQESAMLQRPRCSETDKLDTSQMHMPNPRQHNQRAFQCPPPHREVPGQVKLLPPPTQVKSAVKPAPSPAVKLARPPTVKLATLCSPGVKPATLPPEKPATPPPVKPATPPPVKPALPLPQTKHMSVADWLMMQIPTPAAHVSRQLPPGMDPTRPAFQPLSCATKQDQHEINDISSFDDLMRSQYNQILSKCGPYQN